MSSLSLRMDLSKKSRGEREVMEETLTLWLQDNLAFPYPKYRPFQALCQVIRNDCGNPHLPERMVRRCLDSLRNRRWPQMVYDADLVPVVHSGTGTVAAHSQSYVTALGLAERDVPEVLKPFAPTLAPSTSASSNHPAAVPTPPRLLPPSVTVSCMSHGPLAPLRPPPVRSKRSFALLHAARARSRSRARGRDLDPDCRHSVDAVDNACGCVPS